MNGAFVGIDVAFAGGCYLDASTGAEFSFIESS